ncbi:hypothetical protein L3I75_004762 [Vibrio vulnificus]|uniref:hypothetical protein n=1 Tax=Vibrio vulnificus TaxID=672 RepID=UPI00034991F3|nr:hypothetical protein [Vibrio vulnificus]EWS67531.1 hypothetical protein Y702_20200 [Vibrio vulnificus BAA87]EIU7612890.1 hypothetical protein [Vibrio vulnificus]EIU7863769.1 hypothetical protein [Vibrio vulnificus]EIU7865518.1 hypothetical protein [Vibrio vulnificus]EJE8578698.1 hypothetical protein [Vibrio vulnificus]
MKKNSILLAFILLPSLSYANLSISPELKLGPYKGAGIQVGLTDTLGFDAVFAELAKTRYESKIYDEEIYSYRVGFQQMFGASKQHGFQASLGLAQYDGYLREEHKTANGLSIGGSYVFQANQHLFLRAGFDFNVFDTNATYIPSDTSPNFNLGFGLRF